MRRLAILVAGLALAVPPAAWGWGGSYTAGDGTPIRIDVSDAIPIDQTLPQTWATFVGSLLHGDELGRVTIRLVTPDELRRACGRLAYGCYLRLTQTIMATPTDIPDGPTAREVVTHEYGHHVATNRSNDPWNATSWGTKRWSSYVNVCTRAASRELFPGDQALFYSLNPGEAFAETYRVLNERRAGIFDSSWASVDARLYPDETALALVEQDVLSPWAPTVTSLSGVFRSTARRVWSYGLRTPLDGALVARLRAPRGTEYRLSLWEGPQRLRRGPVQVAFPICGQRVVTLRVDRVRGTAPFTIDVSRP